MAAEMGGGGGPEIEHHHRHTGHKWLDIVLGVSAVAISLMSLFLAIQHGRVMERMLQANTWPFVMVGYSTGNPDGTPHVTMWLTNKGVGPARIDSVELFYQNVPRSDPEALLRAILKPSDPARHFPVIQSDVIDSVLSPKDWMNFVDLDPKKYDFTEYSQIQSAVRNAQFRICYCSVFEECAVLDTRESPVRPVPVKTCPVPRTPFLH